jgi:hypothetical protein
MTAPIILRKTPEVIIGCLKKSDIRLGIFRYYVDKKTGERSEQYFKKCLV